jgi:hypothetical protein
MNKVDQPLHSTNSLKSTAIIGVFAALAGLIEGCRPRLLDRIDATVGSLKENCARVIASPGTKTVSTGDLFVRITGQNGASCECSEDETAKKCSYKEPNKGNGKVNTEVHFGAEVAKNGVEFETNQRYRYVRSGAHIKVATTEGVPVCFELSSNPPSQVGVTPDECKRQRQVVNSAVDDTRAELDLEAHMIAKR